MDSNFTSHYFTKRTVVQTQRLFLCCTVILLCGAIVSANSQASILNVQTIGSIALQLTLVGSALLFVSIVIIPRVVRAFEFRLSDDAAHTIWNGRVMSTVEYSDIEQLKVVRFSNGNLKALTLCGTKSSVRLYGVEGLASASEHILRRVAEKSDPLIALKSAVRTPIFTTEGWAVLCGAALMSVTISLASKLGDIKLIVVAIEGTVVIAGAICIVGLLRQGAFSRWIMAIFISFVLALSIVATWLFVVYL